MIPATLTLTTLLLAATIDESKPARRPMTVDDLWKMARVGAPALSPDGKRAVVSVSTYSVDTNKGTSDLYSIPIDPPGEPVQLTFQAGTDGTPSFSPTGSDILFLSKRGDGPAQLYLLPLGGGEARRATELPVTPQGALFHPDGTKIYFGATTWPDLDANFDEVKKRLDAAKEDPVQAKITESRMLRYWDHYLTDGSVTHLFELDLATNAIRDLTPGSERWMGSGAPSFDLSNDGTQIAFVANSTEPPFQSLNLDIHLLDLDTGMVDNITSTNPADDSGPRFTPDGRALLFGRERRPEIHPDFTRLCRYDLASREITELPLDLASSPSGWTVATNGTILFHAQNAGRTQLLGYQEGEFYVVADGGSTSDVVTGPGGLVVFGRQSITSPTELFALHLRQEGEQQLTHFNRDRLAELDLGTVESTTFAGADDDPVQMFITYPPNFDPERKWPLLLAIHGGPHGAFLDAFHYRWNQALFAAPGYVVAAINFHGSTGFGQAFAESILGNHADKPFADLMAGTDTLLQRGFIDAERMGAAGGSYGGYMVAWILGHTDRFRCLVNHAGVYDLMAQFASDATWGRANNYGASPWSDPSRIDLYSPSRFASHFKTPTLTLHGEKDYRVPYTQGVNLHGVLTAKGVPSRIVIFPEENHWILNPKSAVVWWREVHGWLAHYIKAGPTEERLKTKLPPLQEPI